VPFQRQRALNVQIIYVYPATSVAGFLLSVFLRPSVRSAYHLINKAEVVEKMSCFYSAQFVLHVSF
jgi:hypothetical protein